MSMPPVVIFCFAGRRANVELQLPFMRRLVDEHPNVSVAYWNLARTPQDREWLPTIGSGRITVRNDLHWNEKYDGTGFGYAPVYGWYTQPQYRDHILVKIDDDVVFAQTGRFGAFIEAAQQHREQVVSANVVNNGACTPLIGGLWDKFTTLGIPLLDVHMSNAYAAAAHQHFFDHHKALLDAPLALVPTQDWLSINCLALNYPALCHISGRVGAAQPKYISDRMMREWGPKIGDEGVVNEMDRTVVKGFTVAHLTFGPQQVTDGQADRWRAEYKAIASAYLAGTIEERAAELPATLSEASYAYPLAPGDYNISPGWQDKYTDPNRDMMPRNIIRTIAPGPAVRRKVCISTRHQLASMAQAMMAFPNPRLAAQFASSWAACQTPEQEHELMKAWLPEGASTYGMNR